MKWSLRDAKDDHPRYKQCNKEDAKTLWKRCDFFFFLALNFSLGSIINIYKL